MALLLPVTVAGIINWCVRSTIECRIKFIQHYLWKTSHAPMDLAEASRWFVLDYLGHDGVFLLRLIEINHGSAVVTTIIDLLYARYMENISAEQHPAESPVLSTLDLQDMPGPPGPDAGSQPVIFFFFFLPFGYLRQTENNNNKKSILSIFFSFITFNVKSRVATLAHAMSSSKIINEKGSILRFT